MQKKQIKLFITDVDGVLTNGMIHYSDSGDRVREFNVKDGLGLVELQKKIPVIIISNHEGPSIKNRIDDLKIKHAFLGTKDKLETVMTLASVFDIKVSEIAYMGDDLTDIQALKAVGFPFCPADATKEVKLVCKYITNSKGGKGAIREVCNLILNEIKEEE